MFVFNGQPLSPDVAFTDPKTGIQYPANWLRLASSKERAAIGIKEVPDPPSWDQRFYWGYDSKGALIPKDHAQLVSQWVEQTRTTANSLLSPTDWQVIRELDNGTAMKAEWKTWREDVRVAAQEKVVAIEATADTKALAEYITGLDYSSWPARPADPATAPEV
jgi:hypothetical protein